MATVENALAQGDHPNALSIAELYNMVDAVLLRSFPRGRGMWVRGEVQTISDRTGHCFIDLIDTEEAPRSQRSVLKVKCWRTTWEPLFHSLSRQGITLEPGMVIVIRGALDLYRARGELGFVMTDLDVTAILGQMAASRAALISALKHEDLFDRQRRLPMPLVPLRLAVVASPGTEGYRDLLGQLRASALGFQVTVIRSSVQGRDAPTSIVRALDSCPGFQPDLVVLVRGGGSKADLAPFDTEQVARAIANLSVPVWTGIGHTGDESVADLVSHRGCSTPTECGRLLRATVETWWSNVAERASIKVAEAAQDALVDLDRRNVTVRSRMVASAWHQLRWHREQLSALLAVLRGAGPKAADAAQSLVRDLATRLASGGINHVTKAEERLLVWRRLLAAYDVDRQLERGYTLTLDAGGAVIRSVDELTPGDEMVTRFADGLVHAKAERVERQGLP